jgi:hypothetical protein
MKNANKHAVRIDDLDVAGPELSDEELRVTHGGFCVAGLISTCDPWGDDDWDENPEPCTHVL